MLPASVEKRRLVMIASGHRQPFPQLPNEVGIARDEISLDHPIQPRGQIVVAADNRLGQFWVGFPRRDRQLWPSRPGLLGFRGGLWGQATLGPEFDGHVGAPFADTVGVSGAIWQTIQMPPWPTHRPSHENCDKCGKTAGCRKTEIEMATAVRRAKLG